MQVHLGMFLLVIPGAGIELTPGIMLKGLAEMTVDQGIPLMVGKIAEIDIIEKEVRHGIVKKTLTMIVLLFKEVQNFILGKEVHPGMLIIPGIGTGPRVLILTHLEKDQHQGIERGQGSEIGACQEIYQNHHMRFMGTAAVLFQAVHTSRHRHCRTSQDIISCLAQV